MKKIKLESLYTPYTLDTYQTFTFDNIIEGGICAYNQEYNTNYDFDDFDFDDFDFDHKKDKYLKALADNRLELLKDNIIDNVIMNIIKDGEPISPQYYNYTTDKVFNIFIVNTKELDKYILKNQDDYNKNKLSDCDGFWWYGDENQTKLNYYLYKKSINDYSKDDYLMDQSEDMQDHEYIDFNLIIK